MGVIALVLWLHGTMGDAATNKLLTLSIPGSGFFTGTSPTMLLAVYTFLQMTAPRRGTSLRHANIC
jgi:hypothetical protein